MCINWVCVWDYCEFCMQQIHKYNEKKNQQQTHGLLNPNQKTQAQTTFIGIKNIYRILFW